MLKKRDCLGKGYDPDRECCGSKVNKGENGGKQYFILLSCFIPLKRVQWSL